MTLIKRELVSTFEGSEESGGDRFKLARDGQKPVASNFST